MKPVARILQFPLRVWHRFLSPLLPPTCRFHPTCSVYAVQALEKHPLPRALALIVRRVACCQPFHSGGFDPVPEPESSAGRTGGGAPRG